MTAALQLDLFPELVTPEPDPTRTIQEQFLAFHHLNPAVYDNLVRLARQFTQTGRTRLGMKMLWEVLRWQQALSTHGEPWKLNNTYASRYARLIMAEEPDLSGVFDTRELGRD